MHAHDPHDIFAFARHWRQADIRLVLKLVEKTQESIEALAREGAELPGTLVEIEQIRAALLSVIEAAAECEIPGVVVNPPDQLREGAEARDGAPLLELLEEIAQARR